MTQSVLENRPVAGKTDHVIPVSMILSCFALAIAIATAAWVAMRDPLGAGMARYDLRTPKASLLARHEIERDGDIKAILQLSSRYNGKLAAEFLNTVDVRKEVEWKGAKVLFYSYEAEGIRKYNVQGFERDASTGLWLPNEEGYFGSADLTFAEVSAKLGGGKVNIDPREKAFYEMVDKWRNSGTL